VRGGEGRIFYNLVSPYSYLAYGRVNRICEEHGAELLLRPMLLGAVQGGRTVGPNRHKEQGELSAPGYPPLGQAPRASDEAPRQFPLHTLKTTRAAVALEGEGISNLSPVRLWASTGEKDTRQGASTR
jgi:2-hydroxychromene-2-carboxylate isomerase